ncbi:MAG: 5-formyltetrahydrofolate cyclo-ligase [Coriobacteriales bacterium]|nr:5-formyltetrahydrofolate cyclo-ligase [Coriobacteriales bacterium]
MASSNGTDASKASLRQSYLSLCEHMPKEFSQRIDGSVLDMLRMLGSYNDAELVLCYLPIHEEIDTRPIIDEVLASGRRLALPYLDPATSKLQFYQIDDAEQITRGARGLAKLPSKDARPLDEWDFLGSVCFVPGLVFDGEGNRVGYGAGYYDEFLAFYPGEKIGLVRSVQVSSNPLPHDDHDIPVDVLVTEGSIWRCRTLF